MYSTSMIGGRHEGMRRVKSDKGEGLKSPCSA